MVNITGSLFQSYLICKRQVWLMAHKIVPDQEHPLIELGRIIDQESYKRDKKNIFFEGVTIDMVKKQEGTFIICEIKKSSKALDAAKLQLEFYLYRLLQKGIDVKGEILVPEEKKRTLVELNGENILKIEDIIKDIEKITTLEKPPELAKNKYCKNCGYKEFCWS
ncbi:CRISPR-associated protein Cas4 [Caldicellulosiruptoraceae bacterium PP1]